MELIRSVFDVLKRFPEDERYDLISPGKRAVVSIGLNIAEGSGRKADGDTAHPLYADDTAFLFEEVI